MKLTQQDKARLLGIDARTLRNWRKEKTYLYDIIEKGFAFEEFLKTAQEKIDDLKKLEDSLKKASDKGYKRAASFLKLLNDPENIDTN